MEGHPARPWEVERRMGTATDQAGASLEVGRNLEVRPYQVEVVYHQDTKHKQPTCSIEWFKHTLEGNLLQVKEGKEEHQVTRQGEARPEGKGEHLPHLEVEVISALAARRTSGEQHSQQHQLQLVGEEQLGFRRHPSMLCVPLIVFSVPPVRVPCSQSSVVLLAAV